MCKAYCTECKTSFKSLAAHCSRTNDRATSEGQQANRRRSLITIQIANHRSKSQHNLTLAISHLHRSLAMNTSMNQNRFIRRKESFPTNSHFYSDELDDHCEWRTTSTAGAQQSPPPSRPPRSQQPNMYVINIWQQINTYNI